LGSFAFDTAILRIMGVSCASADIAVEVRVEMIFGRKKFPGAFNVNPRAPLTVAAGAKTHVPRRTPGNTASDEFCLFVIGRWIVNRVNVRICQQFFVRAVCLGNVQRLRGGLRFCVAILAVLGTPPTNFAQVGNFLLD